MKPLAGCNIWVTRPVDLAEGLCAAIEAQGGEVLAYPTLVIQPCPLPFQVASEAILTCDQIIFTSQPAIQRSPLELLLLLKAQQQKVQILAIGAATARFLEQQEIRVDFVPSIVGSAGLLQEAPSLQNIAQQVILVITGKDGLPLLSETLKARGAGVLQLNTYERQLPPMFKDWATWQSCQAIVVGSLVALENAYACLPSIEAREWLQSVTGFVGSPRLLKEVSKQYPKQRFQLAKSPYDADIMEALVRWWHDMPK